MLFLSLVSIDIQDCHWSPESGGTADSISCPPSRCLVPACPARTIGVLQEDTFQTVQVAALASNLRRTSERSWSCGDHDSEDRQRRDSGWLPWGRNKRYEAERVPWNTKQPNRVSLPTRPETSHRRFQWNLQGASEQQVPCQVIQPQIGQKSKREASADKYSAQQRRPGVCGENWNPSLRRASIRLWRWRSEATVRRIIFCLVISSDNKQTEL